MKSLFAIAAAAATLAACQGAPQQSAQSPEPLMATAALKPSKSSKAFGEATFEQVADNKVHVLVNAQGLSPNQEHGFHIHEVGDCSSGDGMSTKGHFNPSGKPHGNASAGDHHAGDLPALKADKGGRAKLDVTIDGITLAPGPTSIMGRGLIITPTPTTIGPSRLAMRARASHAA